MNGRRHLSDAIPGDTGMAAGRDTQVLFPDRMVMFLIGSMADMAFTIRGMELGFKELNVAATSLSGPGDIVLLKLLSVTLFVGAIMLVYRRYRYAARVATSISTLIVWAAAIFNFVQIMIDS